MSEGHPSSRRTPAGDPAASSSSHSKRSGSARVVRLLLGATPDHCCPTHRRAPTPSGWYVTPIPKQDRPRHAPEAAACVGSTAVQRWALSVCLLDALRGQRHLGPPLSGSRRGGLDTTPGRTWRDDAPRSVIRSPRRARHLGAPVRQCVDAVALRSLSFVAPASATTTSCFVAPYMTNM